ncbi:hypothetical protein [Flexibacterium corallicola]|uniref:hypothetical protein n=1 Tax=Flexibacterium corallicola TaxID=3037259 RepID=UPI00286F9C99|nr:hypothetical protein [Pseudovibrio sp. M1P-2-3]
MTIRDIYEAGEGGNEFETSLGLRLESECNNHFREFLGHLGIGLGYGSCSAVVALAPTSGYPTISNLDYLAAGEGGACSLIYGCSRLYVGLDHSYNQTRHNTLQLGCIKAPFAFSSKEQHAEQTAILIAEKQKRPFFQHEGCNYLYVDIPPCKGCGPWLQRRSETWVVFYGDSSITKASTSKKRKRKEEFGRINEPRSKRRVTVKRGKR